jgi:hypothetical protein
MEWRGVGDKPAKKRETRLLTKGAQLPYSGCVKALPLAYPGLMSMRKTWVGKPSLGLHNILKDVTLLITSFRGRRYA